MRYASKTDANHADIVAQFRELGCSVRQTYQLPDGGGDIIVGLHGLNVLVEIKDGEKPPHERKLTQKEEQFREKWQGRYEIIESRQDAIDLVIDIALWAARMRESYGWRW